MKIRNGFVSNSSSSSFIIGIGEVIDREALMRKLGEIGFVVDGWDLKLIETSEIMDPERNHWETPEADFIKDYLKVESFMDDVVTIDFDRNKDQTFFAVNKISGDDSDFAVYTRGGDFLGMDYHIDIDFFSKEEQELINIFHDESLIKNGSTSFGAGRNG